MITVFISVNKYRQPEVHVLHECNLFKTIHAAFNGGHHTMLLPLITAARRLRGILTSEWHLNNYKTFFKSCLVPENIHSHPMDGHGNSEETGVSKAMISKLNWNFWRGGVKPNNYLWGTWTFSRTTRTTNCIGELKLNVDCSDRF